jgi:hypothetical protein
VTPTPTPTVTPRVRAKLGASFKVAGSKTTITKLALSSVPKGGKASVRCKGKGCPFRSKAAKTTAGKANLLALFKTKRTLRAKAVLEIRVTKAGSIGQVMRYAIRNGKAPLKSNWCLMPASTTPRKTC